MKGVSRVNMTPHMTVKDEGGNDILEKGKTVAMLRFASHSEPLKPEGPIKLIFFELLLKYKKKAFFFFFA